MAPAGDDPAVLYGVSILRPDIINDVHATSDHLLDSPSGRVAQLAAIGEAAAHALPTTKTASPRHDQP